MLKNHKQFVEQKEILKVLYAKNNYESSVMNFDRMEVCAMYSLRIFKGMLSLYILCGMVFNFWPFVEYLWSGKLDTPLPARIPYVDHSTTKGFIILFSFLAFMNSMAGVGLAFADNIFVFFAFNVLTFSGLILNQCRQLNEMLVSLKHKPGCIRFKFRNIILMHKEMNE